MYVDIKLVLNSHIERSRLKVFGVGKSVFSDAKFQ